MDLIEKAYQVVTGKEPAYHSVKKEDLKVGTSFSEDVFECSEAAVGDKKILLIRKENPRQYEVITSSKKKGIISASSPRGPDDVYGSDIEFIRREFPDADISSLIEELDRGVHGAQ